ncbi:hypothetical protein GCM10023149_48910 [Mucilaginibacter gynuensis]|uniref:Uncharacterized protein n=2 Tax=Mucilaginibacter gynuensis TaxID=1302236 RepID=A0ABP8HG74_9SPHI
MLDLLIPRKKHKNNRIILHFPGKGLRVRNVQTTAVPPIEVKWPVLSYDDWSLYIRVATDREYSATAAADTFIATEMLICDAKEIIHYKKAN